MRQALTDETFMKLWHTQFKKRREAAGLKDEVRVAALAGLIGDTFVTDLLLHRHGSLGTRRAQNKMTGEWIVFDKTTGGRNVYLALATHNETNQQILARIQTMVAVYPDLANLSGLKTAA